MIKTLKSKLFAGGLSIILCMEGAWSGCIEELGLAIPPKFIVSCKSSVQQNRDGSFNYFYDIANSLSSNQSINGYYIEVKDTSVYPLTRDRKQFKYNVVELKGGIINPPDWYGTRHPSDRFISWHPNEIPNENYSGVAPLQRDIFPGQRLFGFGNEARLGPPTIGAWWVLPWKPMLQSNIDGGGEPVYESVDSAGVGVRPLPRMELDELGEGEYMLRGKKISKDCADEITAATSAWLQDQPHDSRLIPALVGMQDAVGGRTLVASDPIPAGAEGVCGALDRLIGEVRQAEEMGWIRDDLRKPPRKAEAKGDDKDGDDEKDDESLGFAESIVKKLEKARRDCGRGRMSNVRRMLSAVLSQVNAQREKHLTDEAYYLLRLNVIYLLERL